jgi:PilZ domain
MSSKERRRQPRTHCSIWCDLIVNGVAVQGEVRNISVGGLGVVADAPALEQGEGVGVVLRVPGGAPISIQALVWHVQAVRHKADPKSTRSWGLVLAEPSPEYAKLIEQLTVPASPAPKRPLGVPSANRRAEAPPPPATPLRQYAIRIQQVGKPRTCQVVASGTSLDDAVKTALAEVGAGWAMIDARAVD